MSVLLVLMTVIRHRVLLLFFHFHFDKDEDCLQSNNNVSSNSLC